MSAKKPLDHYTLQNEMSGYTRRMEKIRGKRGKQTSPHSSTIRTHHFQAIGDTRGPPLLYTGDVEDLFAYRATHPVYVICQTHDAGLSIGMNSTEF